MLDVKRVEVEFDGSPEAISLHAESLQSHGPIGERLLDVMRAMASAVSAVDEATAFFSLIATHDASGCVSVGIAAKITGSLQPVTSIAELKLSSDTTLALTNDYNIQNVDELLKYISLECLQHKSTFVGIPDAEKEIIEALSLIGLKLQTDQEIADAYQEKSIEDTKVGQADWRNMRAAGLVCSLRIKANTIGDIINNYTASELRNVGGLGHTTFETIRDVLLEDFGLQLREG